VGLPGMKLTTSELPVNFWSRKAQNDPFISSPGVKMALNIVNILEDTPLFPL